LNYQLVPATAGARPIDEKLSLTQAGVVAGMELLLRPESDELLDKVVEKLYDEIKDFIKEKSWELAKQKLEELFHLNPSYPDPAGLKAILQAKFAASNPLPQQTSAQHTSGLPKPRTTNIGCCVGAAVAAIAAVAVAAAGIVVVGWLLSQSGTQNTQTKGSFTAELVPSANTYYFIVTAKPGENMRVDVNGTDGYHNSWSGVGQLQTDVIPRGASGVVDTIQVTSLDSGEVENFTFTFK
jgi:hypothetical protein